MSEMVGVFRGASQPRRERKGGRSAVTRYNSDDILLTLRWFLWLKPLKTFKVSFFSIWYAHYSTRVLLLYGLHILLTQL